ncbi:MAG: GNAT family N-acetyltransferase [Clostridia bacterium]|nr:GNAT family N-acetyltransferase [Clostridia bacterium]
MPDRTKKGERRGGARHAMFRLNPYGLFAMPMLESERLILRRIAMRDAKDIFAYSKDPEVARHVLWSAQKELSEAKEYCRYMMKRYRNDEPASWGIIEKKTDTLVGTIGYMDYSEDNASVEVGYSLARWMWNGGYMTEALRRVIAYTFESMDINRIEAQHETDNPSSGRVMEKCGMRKEGVLRQRLYNKGAYRDVALYAILREDYETGKKQGIFE